MAGNCPQNAIQTFNPKQLYFVFRAKSACDAGTIVCCGMIFVIPLIGNAIWSTVKKVLVLNDCAFGFARIALIDGVAGMSKAQPASEENLLSIFPDGVATLKAEPLPALPKPISIAHEPSPRLQSSDPPGEGTDIGLCARPLRLLCRKF